ncbi:hypothetical protein [Lichenicoccus sp.]|uniref:hypothetical protein n=1 Tax=Lichenicoccus sp. TaxID=2781899 RepID=UPI003D0EA447
MGRDRTVSIRKSDMPPAGTSSTASVEDAAVLTACATFAKMYAEQEADNRNSASDDDVTDEISSKWLTALAAIVDAPMPLTHSGRLAVIAAARAAFIDEVSGAYAQSPEQREKDFCKMASDKQRLVLKALTAAAGGLTT